MLRTVKPIPLGGLNKSPLGVEQKNSSHIISLVYNDEIVGVRAIYNGKEYDIDISTLNKLNYCGLSRGLLHLQKVDDTFKSSIEITMNYEVREISDDIDLCKKVLRMG